MSYIIKCDRCGETGEQGNSQHLPQKWRAVGLTVKVVGGTWNKSHQFCPVCAEHLGLGDEPPDDETSAEKLVAILESMVDEAVDERG